MNVTTRRQVGLIGQHLQIAHQLHVIVEVAGMPAGDRCGQLARALLLGLLDAPLDVANGVEVFDDLHASPARASPEVAASR
jgi:hypothetical protein